MIKDLTEPEDLILSRARWEEDLPPERHWLVRLRSSLWQQKPALVGVLILLFVVLLALLAPLVAPFDPDEQSFSRALKPPLTVIDGQILLMGGDHLGRDLFSRVVYGSRISIVVGFFAVLFSGGIGLMIGLISGYFGGKVDYFLMRVADFVLSFPFILMALAMIAILGSSLWLIILVMSMRLWVIYARVVRGNVLSLRETEFVVAARGMGASPLRIILQHLMPNVLPPVIIIASLYLGRMIIIEAGLSFLGLGVPPPTPTWGGLLAEGRSYLYVSWWIVTFPGLAITITVLGTNLVGDWLRDVLDPRLRSR